MFQLIRPSPFGLVLRVVVVALWAILWIVALAQLLRGPETIARQPGATPELARVEVLPLRGGPTA